MQNTLTSSDLLALSAELSAQEDIVAPPASSGTYLEVRLKEGRVLEGHLPKLLVVNLRPHRLT